MTDNLNKIVVAKSRRVAFQVSPIDVSLQVDGSGRTTGMEIVEGRAVTPERVTKLFSYIIEV